MLERGKEPQTGTAPAVREQDERQKGNHFCKMKRPQNLILLQQAPAGEFRKFAEEGVWCGQIVPKSPRCGFQAGPKATYEPSPSPHPHSQDSKVVYAHPQSFSEISRTHVGPFCRWRDSRQGRSPELEFRGTLQPPSLCLQPELSCPWVLSGRNTLVFFPFLWEAHSTGSGSPSVLRFCSGHWSAQGPCLEYGAAEGWGWGGGRRGHRRAGPRPGRTPEVCVPGPAAAVGNVDISSRTSKGILGGHCCLERGWLNLSWEGM